MSRASSGYNRDIFRGGFEIEDLVLLVEGDGWVGVTNGAEGGGDEGGGVVDEVLASTWVVLCQLFRPL